MDAGTRDDQTLDAIAKAYEWNRVEAWDADLAIVSDLVNVPTVILMAAVLNGAYITIKSCVVGDTYGPVLKFMPATHKAKRKVFISNGLASEHPDVYEILVKCINRQGSTWKRIADLNEWVVEKQKAISRKVSASAILICTDTEMPVFMATNVPHIFNIQGLLSFIRQHDKLLSSMGMSCM